LDFPFLGYEQPKVNNVINVGNEIDVALCEKGYFEALLEDHVPWAVAFAYYPPCGIVFETLKLVHHQVWRQQKRALTINSQVNLNQAAALWRHQEEYKAKKRVFFVLQMTIFGTQLVMTGRIYDFWEEANALRPILFDPAIDTWEKFIKVWRPYYDLLVDRFIDLRNSYRIRELEYIRAIQERREVSEENIQQIIFEIYSRKMDFVSSSMNGNLVVEHNPLDSSTKMNFDSGKANNHSGSSNAFEPPSELQLLYPGYERHGMALTSQYILRNGLHSLERDMALLTTRHPKIPNLIHLTRTPTLSPVDSLVCSESYGMVLDENDQYRPVAWSHHRYYKIDEEGPARIDLWGKSSIQAFQNPDGVLVELYWYRDEWHVATERTSDGSESFDIISHRSVSYLFWEVWNGSSIDLKQLDPKFCYSFWLLHPLARQRVLHLESQLILEGAVQWAPSGLIDIPISDLRSLFPFSTLQDVNGSGKIKNNMKTVPDSLSLPLGGLILQHGSDRFSRILAPCAYMQRLDNIEKMEGDYLAQELEMVRLLVEQPGVSSAWIYPLPVSITTFNIVSQALKALIVILEEYRPKLPSMGQAEVMAEAEKLGDIGHFIFLLKSTKPPFESVTEFLKHANPRRMRKYLVQWWTKEHSNAPPRHSLQYSYK
jgi:hypothetical protein